MNARAHALYGARQLADWIRDGGRFSRASPGYRLRLWWHAKWFEINWQTASRRLASVPLPEDPVFVFGLWRSGTTVLHELLAACGRWATPQTWQCFSPSTCFLSGPPSEESVARRPMDDGRIATLGPQEDEFALLLLGEPSAYRGFIDPRRLRECGELLWSGAEGTLSRWQDFLRGVAAASPGARLLLKSPNHTFRLPLLSALFPRAQFIWIGRDTGEVLASNRKMWRTMMELYGLWECPPHAIEGLMRDMVRACAAVLGRCVDVMPQDRMLWVDFEQLHAHPKEVLQRVLRFIAPSPAHDAQAAARAIDLALTRVPIHPGSRAPLPNDPDVHELEAAMAAARQRFDGSAGPPGARPLPG